MMYTAPLKAYIFQESHALSWGSEFGVAHLNILDYMSSRQFPQTNNFVRSSYGLQIFLAHPQNTQNTLAGNKSISSLRKGKIIFKKNALLGGYVSLQEVEPGGRAV